MIRRATYTADIVGITTLTFGRMMQSPRDKGESAEAHDKRCWKERCHTTKEGFVEWPIVAFKMGMVFAAKLKGEKIKGKGQRTYTASFNTGIMPDPTAPPAIIQRKVDGLWRKVHIDDIEGRDIAVPADGKKGGSKRVYRRFPEIDPPWTIIGLSFVVIDDDLIENPDCITEAFEKAGVQAGIGCNRPQTAGGDHGMFLIENVKFEVLE